MSERPTNTTTPRKPPDRWSGRKTLLFIVGASVLLWALIVALARLI
jgi:hypothetical protein